MTMIRILAAAALTAALTGCMHKVPVSYLEAADINVAQDIQTVLVIDRSRARGGEHVLNAAEGALTGETYRLDADSAALALEALEDVLETGQRFEVVNFRVNGRAVDTSMWDRQLTAQKVRQLCRRAKCDAVVALDAFDSDSYTSVEREVDRDTRDVDFEATQSTDVAATFRMYDGDTGRVLDEKSLFTGSDHTSGEEDTAEEAVNDLPYEAAVFDGAAALGATYASRISPHAVVDTRSIYGSGSKQMRAAKKAAKRGNLAAAVAIWQKVTVSGDDTLAAKAFYNIAVAAEANGNVRRAARLAQRAAEMAGKKRMHTYVAVLSDRSRNDIRVGRQLGVSLASN